MKRKKEYKFFVDRRGGRCWFIELRGKIYDTRHIGKGRDRFTEKQIEKIFKKRLYTSALDRRNEGVRRCKTLKTY